VYNVWVEFDASLCYCWRKA